MAQPQTEFASVRFGVFEFDARANELRRKGVRVRLQYQPLQILRILLKNSGRIVTREQLRAALWRDCYVDFEHGLNSAIRRLRHALGDSGQNPRFIEAVPREGYRFIGATKPEAPAPPSEGAGGAVSAPRPSAMAVLDFRNLSGNDGLDWLGTGLAESMAAALSRLDGVSVLSREAVYRVLQPSAAEPELLQKAADRLHAERLLTGSYVECGNRLRITYRLLTCPSGDVIDSGVVDGAADEVLDLQDAIISRVAAALPGAAGAMQPAEADYLDRALKRPTQRLDAYEHYARGRHGLFQMGRASLAAAIGHFELAIEADPRYALAHCALGGAYAFRFAHHGAADDLEQAATSLETAVRLEPSLGEAYSWMCYVCTRRDRPRHRNGRARRGLGSVAPGLLLPRRRTAGQC